MALNQNPSIVTNGLVFYYDTYNRRKSYIGEPTTNQFAIPTPDSNSNVSFSVNGTGTFKRIYTGNYGGYEIQSSDIVYRYDLGNTGCHYHGNDVTITSGQYPTFTFDYFLSNDVTSFSDTFMANFENLGSGVSGSAGLPNYYKGVWQTIQINGSIATATSGLRMLLYPGGCSSSRLAATGYLLMRNPQVTFSSSSGRVMPFVAGTRSSTQGLLDTVGSKTIELVNTNTTSFTTDPNGITLDGNNQYIYAYGGNYWNAWSQNGVNGNSELTIEVIFKSSDTSGYIISRPWNGSGQYNYTMLPGSFGLHIGANSASFGYSNICTGSVVHMVYWMNSTQYGVYRNGQVYVAATNHGLSGGGGSAGTNDFGTSFGTLYPYGQGWGGNTGFSINGNFYNGKIYNRVLSASEILQNFNATRGIYGI